MALTWLDVTTCNFCGSDKSKLYLESKVPKWYENRPLRIVECLDCGLAYSSPRPEKESMYVSYLSGDTGAQKMLEKKLSRPGVLDVHRKHVLQAKKYLGYQPERLYDMGCGAGTIMLAAKDLGIEAFGNDINKACIDWLQGQGFKAQHGFTSNLSIPEEKMDIVINLDYIEHTYTPLEDLKMCFDMLKPGGILYLKTLYLGCPDHKTKGEAWQLFGHGHFYYYTPKVLKEMVKAAGFTIIEATEKSLITIVARRPGGANENTNENQSETKGIMGIWPFRLLKRA